LDSRVAGLLASACRVLARSNAVAPQIKPTRSHLSRGAAPRSREVIPAAATGEATGSAGSAPATAALAAVSKRERVQTNRNNPALSGATGNRGVELVIGSWKEKLQVWTGGLMRRYDAWVTTRRRRWRSEAGGRGIRRSGCHPL
jgi:hypothetical protein